MGEEQTTQETASQGKGTGDQMSDKTTPVIVILHDGQGAFQCNTSLSPHAAVRVLLGVAANFLNQIPDPAQKLVVVSDMKTNAGRN